MRSLLGGRWAATLVALAAAALVVAGCSTSDVARDAAAEVDAPVSATLSASQDSVHAGGVDPQVDTPFWLLGQRYGAYTPVDVTIYSGPNPRGSVVYEVATVSDAAGTVDVLVNEKLAAGRYTAVARVSGTQVATAGFTSSGNPPRPSGIARINQKSGPKSLQSPILRDGSVAIAQASEKGSVFSWALSDLPDAPKDNEVGAGSRWTPALPDKVGMRGMSVDDDGSVLITRKALNINAVGGNSVWSYPWGEADNGKQLAGNTAQAGNGYYTWGNGGSWTPKNQAGGSIAYAKATFPTTTPTSVTIGDGGGVVRAQNGWLYFGSLQSGCVYKQDPSSGWTDTVYCIPSWGSGAQNAATYSLAKDRLGHVYALYQGATDFNTMILRITPAETAEDTVDALQLDGYARSTGLAVSFDGSTIFANGVPMRLYNENNTNTLLTVTNPEWGSAESPVQAVPQALEIPGGPNETWLTGMAYDEAHGIVYIGSNIGGFYMWFQ